MWVNTDLKQLYVFFVEGLVESISFAQEDRAEGGSSKECVVLWMEEFLCHLLYKGNGYLTNGSSISRRRALCGQVLCTGGIV